MKLTDQQIQTVSEFIKAGRANELNQVEIDIADLGDALGVNYRQSKRILRFACEAIGYPVSENIVDVSTKPAQNTKGWAAQREEIAKKLGLVG